MSLDGKIWDAKSAIFDPCLASISLKRHGIGLKILP